MLTLTKPAWMRPQVRKLIVGSLGDGISVFCKLREWTEDYRIEHPAIEKDDEDSESDDSIEPAKKTPCIYCDINTTEMQVENTECCFGFGFMGWITKNDAHGNHTRRNLIPTHDDEPQM